MSTVPYSPALLAVLDATASAIVTTTAEGTINYVNPRAVRDFGYAEEELLGEPVELLVPLDHAAQHSEHHESYLADARLKDGSTVPVAITLTPLPTEEGPWILVGIVDISASRAAEHRVGALSQAHLALAELNAAILRAETSEELLVDACRVLTWQGHHLGAWVGQVGADGTVVAVARSGQVGVFADLPAVADVIAQGVAWFGTEPLVEPASPWRAWAVDSGVAAVACLPLRRGGLPVAALTIYASHEEILTAELRALLVTVADNVSFALDRFDAEERMRVSATQRVTMLGRLVAAQEEERSRIAADVHDHSVQALAAMDLRLGMLHHEIARSAPQLTGQVETIQSGLAEVTTELRYLLFDLETAETDVSLVDQLRDALDHVFDQLATRHTLVVAQGEGVAELPSELRTQALRIFKEALANVRGHARADNIRVTVTPDDDGVEVAVTDDGVGPGADAATLRSAAGHRGLDGMRDRAEATGGWCRLEREDGSTTLRFWLPREPVVA